MNRVNVFFLVLTGVQTTFWALCGRHVWLQRFFPGKTPMKFMLKLMRNIPPSNIFFQSNNWKLRVNQCHKFELISQEKCVFYFWNKLVPTMLFCAFVQIFITFRVSKKSLLLLVHISHETLNKGGLFVYNFCYFLKLYTHKANHPLEFTHKTFRLQAFDIQ